jgi:4'-phosphopantetheinyl transferase
MAVQIWLSSLDELDPAPAQGVLSSDELARAEGMRSPLLRRRFLGRRGMARSLLADATGHDPRELVLESQCARCGKPHPANPLAADPAAVWWSASSSGGIAAVAISACRVGIDLEIDDDRPRWERIARRFYTDAERRAVGSSPTRFLEYWTMKEAFLKAVGVGLVGGLRSIECATLSEPVDDWRTSAAHPGWRFRNLSPEAGFVAAVAIEGEPDSIELRRWNPDAEEAR